MLVLNFYKTICTSSWTN